MMETETTNTHRPISRTLAVIEGGLSSTAGMQVLPATQKPKLFEQVRHAIRTRHYSYMTEKAYVHWIKRFIFFHNKRHPAEMGEVEIAQFLSSLASDSHVSASTQNQALNAVVFLYNHVLEKRIGLIQGIVRAKRSRRLPVVLTKDEVKKVFSCLRGAPWYDAALRSRIALNGVLSSASQRHRFRKKSDCH